MNRLAGFAAVAALALSPAGAVAQRVSQGTVFSVPSILPGGQKATRFYGPSVTNVPVSTAMGAANRLFMSPVYIGAGQPVLKTLSFDIGAGNASAWNARMCVYADTGAGFPGALVVDAGTTAIGSGSVTGVQTATLGGGGTVLPGAAWYWVGMMVDSIAESLFAYNNAIAYGPFGTIVGFGSTANLFTNAPSPGYYMAQTFGACPGSFSASPTDAAGQVLPYIALGF